MKKSTISLWLILGIFLAALGPLVMVTVANVETGKSVAKSKQMLHLGKDAQRLLKENGFVSRHIET